MGSKVKFSKNNLKKKTKKCFSTILFTQQTSVRDTTQSRSMQTGHATAQNVGHQLAEYLRSKADEICQEEDKFLIDKLTFRIQKNGFTSKTELRRNHVKNHENHKKRSENRFKIRLDLKFQQPTLKKCHQSQ